MSLSEWSNLKQLMEFISKVCVKQEAKLKQLLHEILTCGVRPNRAIRYHRNRSSSAS